MRAKRKTIQPAVDILAEFDVKAISQARLRAIVDLARMGERLAVALNHPSVTLPVKDCLFQAGPEPE